MLDSESETESEENFVAVFIGDNKFKNSNNDIESQITNLNTKFLKNNEKPLKSILKKPSDTQDEIDETIVKRNVKICTTTLLIVGMSPTIVCDLYYGFTDNSCINEKPNGLNYTMKLYLLVSGFYGLALLLTLICVTCYLSNHDEKNKKRLVFIKFISLFGFTFQIIWNILGAITFWGTIYKEGNCNLIISTYIYVSLIIKFVSNLIGFKQNLCNKK
jgi:hypothetical protein